MDVQTVHNIDILIWLPYHMCMSYGRMILDRVNRLAVDVKGKFTLYFSKAVYAEFRHKCGEHAPSVVLEEMMRQFNETTPEPTSKKPRSK